MTSEANGNALERPHNLAALVDYSDGSVVSRTLQKNSAGTLTVFAFDRGQGLSEHTAPFEATVLILDGTARWTIGGESMEAKTGDRVVLPAGVPHGVQADERFKMLLVMIRA